MIQTSTSQSQQEQNPTVRKALKIPHGAALLNIATRNYAKGKADFKFWINNNGIAPNLPDKIDDQEVEEVMNRIVKLMKIHGWKKLKAFSISLEECRVVTDKGLEKLILHMKRRFTNVEHIEFYFYKCERISDKGLIYLGSQIGNYSTFPNLKAFKISVYQCSQITDNGINRFSKLVTRGQPLLKNISVSLGQLKGEVSNSIFSNLSKNIGKYLNKLNQLSLEFNDSSAITGQYFAKGMLKILQNSQNLQELTLCFVKSHSINNSCSLEILKSHLLTYSHMLRLLKLRFIKCKSVSRACYACFDSQNLKSLKKLEKVDMEIVEVPKEYMHWGMYYQAMGY